MPELPEVEITARLVGKAVAGPVVESVLAPGLNTLRSFKPPLEDLAGEALTGIRRQGKMLVVDSGTGLSLLIHLMSAGRLQLFGKRAGPRDRTSRILIRLAGGDELRLREHGTHQRAWARLMPTDQVEEDEAVSSLGPEAWPGEPDLEAVVATDRPLYSVLRDQRAIAGIGRAWADEIIWAARLSPFKRASDMTGDERDRLAAAIPERLGDAVGFYERELSLPLPDRMPRPLLVHGREGEDCPSCGGTIHAVHYRDYVMCYCPEEQTGGAPLKDRRLSRLLK